MNKLIKLLSFIIFSVSLNSCVMIQSVSISDVKPSTGTEVTGSASGIGILHITVPKGIAEKATYKLKNNGAVDNVSTVLTMREWGVIQYYKVTAKGTTESK